MMKTSNNFSLPNEDIRGQHTGTYFFSFFFDIMNRIFSLFLYEDKSIIR